MIRLNLVEPKKMKRVDSDAGRVYLTESGQSYPSVTSVLGQRNKDAIIKWRKRVGEEKANHISTQSAGAGTALHKMCESYLLNEEYEKNNPLVRGMFNNMKPHLDKISEVRGVELPMWSDFLKLAGTTDCIGYYKSRLSVIDFKNARKPKKKEWITNYFLQGAAYARMFYELYDQAPGQIVIIVATWDGEIQIFEEKVVDYYDELIYTMREHNPLWSEE